MAHLVETQEQIVRSVTSTKKSTFSVDGAIPNILTIEVTETVTETEDSCSKKSKWKLIPNFTDKSKKVPTHLRKSTPYLVRDGFYEFIKTKPFEELSWTGGKDGDLVIGKKVDPGNLVNDANIVWLYQSPNDPYGRRMIFNSWGEPIASPLVFMDDGDSPLCPSFSESRYDLPALLEYLKSHPWVVNKEELFIDTSIWDYYKYIKVVILPDQESYTAIYNEVKHSLHFINEFRRRICYRPSKRRERKDWLGVGKFSL